MVTKTETSDDARQQGKLIDLGNGLVRDSALNVEWVKNANLAATETFGVQGILSNGLMGWDTAQEWIAAMNAAGYLGHDDWRMPRILPAHGDSYRLDNARDGSTDFGLNVVSPKSEMLYVWYVHLGNKCYCDRSGNGPQEGWGMLNTGPFDNLMPDNYWSGTEVSLEDLQKTHPFWYSPPEVGQGPPPASRFAFNNWLGMGGQSFNDKGYYQLIWAVRSIGSGDRSS